MSETIRVTLADVPTDVLTYLVDNPPASALMIADATAPPDVHTEDAYRLVRSALMLLHEMGWADRGNDGDGAGCIAIREVWFPTLNGRIAIRQARRAPANPSQLSPSSDLSGGV
jgi:hypothetical protein